MALDSYTLCAVVALSAPTQSFIFGTQIFNTTLWRQLEVYLRALYLCL